MNARDVRRIVLEALAGWWKDKAPQMGAALAFYTILAMAPVIVLVTPLAGSIFGHDKAPQYVIEQFKDLVGQQGADAVRTMLAVPPHLRKPSLATTALSIGVLVFAASGVFTQLQDALDTVWAVAPRPGLRAFLALLRKRFLSFAMVLGICFLLLVSLMISAGLAAIRSRAIPEAQSLAFVWTLAHGAVSLAVITLLFAMIFKVLPDATVPWRDVWLGAAITAGLFTLGRFVIGTYLGRASYINNYGAAGPLVAVLVWVYYSAQILYFGAGVHARLRAPPGRPRRSRAGQGRIEKTHLKT